MELSVNNSQNTESSVDDSEKTTILGNYMGYPPHLSLHSATEAVHGPH